MANRPRKYYVAATYDDVYLNCKEKKAVSFCYSLVRLIERNGEDATPAYNKLKQLYRDGKIYKHLLNKITKSKD